MEDLSRRLAEEDLTNGERIDVIAGMLGFALFVAQRDYGEDSVVKIMDRFVDGLSVAVPGKITFMSIDSESNKNWS